MKYKVILPSFSEETPLKRRCEKEECQQEGTFKAPRDRTNVHIYIWLCLEHVREYNAKWDYYKGMDEFEIEKEKRFDETWQRPTWPFNQKVILKKMRADIDKNNQIFSSFNIFESTPPSKLEAVRLTLLEEKALRIINLSYPFDKQDLKKKYLILAKKYHPDANGGSKHAEEYLKKINQAYEILKKLIS